MDDKSIDVDLSITQLQDVLQYCKPKEQLVLLQKFGLKDGKEIPLQRIGKRFNLTRERVRQVETQALMRFRRLIVGNKKYISLLEEANKVLSQNGGILPEKTLITKLVNNPAFTFTFQEIKLILVSDFTISYLKRNRNLDKAFYIDPLYEDLLTTMSIFVVDYFTKRQESQNLYEFVAFMKDKFGKEYDEVEFFRDDAFYMNFFTIVRGLMVFDGKVGLDTFDDINIKTVKLKVLYTLRKAKKPLHYQELPAKIMEWFPGKNIKVNTVHNELVKNSDVFVNVGLGTYALKEWGYEGGLVKDIIVRILDENDRPMTVKEICRELLKEKMASANTVLLNLQKHKELFERTDKGVYQLKK
ncbi:MAG: hypothetical protein H6766_03355 [Candidatus Peribacteria bacterium]|nr:MAG: hypothetical protein H6766_03355 [Candidatus Peribacteria bacterium]